MTGAKLEGTDAASRAGARSAWALLRDRSFGLYFFGTTLANIGMWAYNVAAVVSVFTITRSALHVGLVTMCQFAAPLLLAPVGGVLADRFDRRKLIMVTLTAASAALASLTLWAALAGLTHPLPILMMSLGLGLVTAITDPPRHALVASLVPPSDLGQAVTLNAFTFNLGRTMGPALGGFVLVWSGPALVFGLAAAGYLVSVGSLAMISPRVVARRAAGAVDRGFAAGIRYIWAHKRMLAMLLGVAAAGFGSDPVVTLAPLLADRLVGYRDLLGITDVELAAGVLAAAYGAGAVLSLALLRRLTRRIGYRTTGVAGLVTLASTMTLLTVAPGLLVATALLLVGGAGFFATMTSMTTMVQLDVPEHLRGRVMAVWGVFFLGSRPLAALIDSTVTHLASLNWALVGMAALVAGAAVVVARTITGTVRAGPLAEGSPS